MQQGLFFWVFNTRTCKRISEVSGNQPEQMGSERSNHFLLNVPLGLASFTAGQVRFKDIFYGHSERTGVTEGRSASAQAPVDAVAEWRSLQNATPPVRLADHLTWLRMQGTTEDPRLLTTLADRPPSGGGGGKGGGGGGGSNQTTPIPTSRGIHHGERGENDNGAGQEGQNEHTAGGGDGRTGVNASLAGRDATADAVGTNSGVRLPASAIVPLEPFLQMAHQRRLEYDSVDGGVQRRTGGSNQTRETKRVRLTHDVHTRLQEVSPGVGKRVDVGDEGERSEWAAAAEAEAAEKCGFLHLVVDGVVFQVNAAKPKGVTRVWASVLPAVSKHSTTPGVGGEFGVPAP